MVAAIVAWIMQYGSIIGFFVQIAFYVAVGGSSIWAATTLARYVKYMTTEEEIVEEAATPVDEFVE